MNLKYVFISIEYIEINMDRTISTSNLSLVVTNNSIRFTIVYNLPVMIFRIFYSKIQLTYNLIYTERTSSHTCHTYKLYQFHLWISAKEIVNIWKMTSLKLKFWKDTSQRFLVQSIYFKCSYIRLRILAFTWYTSDFLKSTSYSEQITHISCNIQLIYDWG